MGYSVTVLLFVFAVILVCFMVHILCQNHTLRKEKESSVEKVSRLFDHNVTRRMRSGQSHDLLLSFASVNQALGAFAAFERIYEGATPSLAEILRVELDLVQQKLDDKADGLENILRDLLPTVLLDESMQQVVDHASLSPQNGSPRDKSLYS